MSVSIQPDESLIKPIPDRLADGPSCSCGRPARLTDGSEIYPDRPDLWAKPIWTCLCGSSYVGCHPGTIRALGTPADRETRRAREAAHAAFDPLWRSKAMSRTEAYRRLARHLGLSAEACHIALFDIATCLHVQGLVAAGALSKKA